MFKSKIRLKGKKNTSKERRPSKFTFTIGKKISSGFLIVLIIFAGGSVFNLTQLNSFRSTLNNMTEQAVPSIQLALEIEGEHERSYGILVDYLESLRSENTSNQGKYQKEYSEALSLLDSYYSEYEPLLTSEEEKSLYNRLSTHKETFYNKGEEIITLTTFDLVKINRLRDEIEMALTNIQANGTQLVEYNEDKVASAREQAKGSMESIWVNTIVLLIVSSILGISIAFFVSTFISRPVKKVTSELKKVSTGDLSGSTIMYKGKDEIGEMVHALNDMQRQLSSFLKTVSDSSMQLAASSEELYASSEQTTKATNHMASLTQESTVGAENQLTSVRKVSESVDQLSMGLQQVAIKAVEMSEVANQANSASMIGKNHVQHVVEQMQKIRDTVLHSSEVVNQLSSQTNEIGKITQLILEVAEQTNLLSLNAAIEAARAGEHGKGFAVVADEVRKLADQTRESSQEITRMIESIQEETKRAMTVMREGTSQVEQGMSLTNEVEDAFGTIEGNMGSVTEKVQDVSDAVEQMAFISSDIVNSVDVVREVAELSALSNQESSAASEEQLATMEEIESSAKGLSQLAEQLQEEIARFKLES
ncbi:methyl-accepting chemotaxis protein [Bacillus coahuilensis]|uniref:methyl-accepting chemotaxis protein n=1 Tax=Bacillus coahuilensis TaxID=408580 RepID=UPI000750BAC7|nr:HAMP domain-containing methyl-accepting chemotaxis protein [Bacillus coahuilensis]